MLAARLAIGFALPFLIGNGDIMLCLPRRRDAQIQGGALHYAKLRIAVARYRFGFHGVSSDNRHCAVATGRYRVLGRSEEHTSELQSLMRISYAVFCLKKKI